MVYTSFKLQQNYIAENLCVMKDVEDNTCQGSCQLKRKLNFDKSENDDKEGNPMVIPVYRYNNYKLEESTAKLTVPVYAIINQKKSIDNVYWYGEEFINSIFHPPKV